MKLSKTNRIRSTNFKNAWYEAIKFVLLDGIEFTFGTPGEGKVAFDSVQEIILTGHALRQIEDHVVHPQYKFGGKRLEEYCKEFTSEFLREYNNKTRECDRFDYMYYERLTRHSGIDDGIYDCETDQLEIMNERLGDQLDSEIASNFCQAITWEVGRDGTYAYSSPCLQRIWMRWYEPNIVDVHLSWRSRDLYGAWPSNIVAITEMLNREVIKPNKCEIGRIIDYSDSLHIYDYNLEEAKLVKEVPEFHGV
jgi:thymidylate synthase